MKLPILPGNASMLWAKIMERRSMGASHEALSIELTKANAVQASNMARTARGTRT